MDSCLAHNAKLRTPLLRSPLAASLSGEACLLAVEVAASFTHVFAQSSERSLRKGENNLVLAPAGTTTINVYAVADETVAVIPLNFTTLLEATGSNP